jgi:tyrosyl-tRNA synthetase
VAETQNIIPELDARTLVADVTDRDGLGALLASQNVPVYAGYDPTSPSLHVGNLVPTVMLARLQRAGHTPIIVVGGATGMIGDPSGHSDERNLLDEETLVKNRAGIRAQLETLLAPGYVLVDNYDWFKGISFLGFLRDVGKYLSINYMMGKDSVKSRLEDRDAGISYTEFSYMLLQSWDFVHLSRAHGCRLQVGGSDQYGNITAGCELSRKLGGPQLYGLTAPLLLDSSGQKMGKTASGEKIWLDPARTSPYAFYQYWLNQTDDLAPRLFKKFSFRPLAEIDDVLAEHDRDRSKRLAQRECARDLTRWVHGDDGVRRAEVAASVLFGGGLDGIGDADLAPLVSDVGHVDVPAAELAVGVSLIDLLVRSELMPSRGEARRRIAAKSIYVNNVQVSDENAKLTDADRGTPSFILLRHGKKQYKLVRIV